MKKEKRRNIGKRLLAFLLAMLVCISGIPTTFSVQAEEPEIFYIRDNYRDVGDMYLYEKDGAFGEGHGELRFNVPKTDNDQAYQWTVEERTVTDADGAEITGKVLKNVATGHYINVDTNVAGVALGWNGSVAVSDYEETVGTAFLWNFDITEPTKIERTVDDKFNLNPQTSINEPDTFMYTVQCRSDVDPGYGSLKWDFIPKADFTVPEEISYYLIENLSVGGQYLVESAGSLKSQALSGSISAEFCWRIEEVDGQTYLKNRKSGAYLSVGETGLTMAAEQKDATDWSLTDGATTLKVSGNDTDYLYLSGGDVVWGSEDPETDANLWQFVLELEKTDNVPINIYNQGRGLYMVEENGSLTYDNALSSDVRAQWILEKDENGIYSVKNVGTDHYIMPSETEDFVNCVNLADVNEPTDVFAWNKIMMDNGRIVFGDAKANEGTDSENMVIRNLNIGGAKGYVENARSSRRTGNAQWDLRICDGEEMSYSYADIPDETVTRISNQFGEAIYENQTYHSVLYNTSSKTGVDWKLIASDTPNQYYVQNTASGRYLGADNGQSVAMYTDNTNNATLWQFETYTDSNHEVVIRNAEYSKRYLNISGKRGYMECSLVSTSADAARWVLESLNDQEQSIPATFYWEFRTDGTAFEPGGLPAHIGVNIYSKLEGYLSMATGEGDANWTSVQCRNDGVETWGTSKFNLLLVDGTEDIYYIQNGHMSTQYLHDGDGILSYDAQEENANFQWKLMKTDNGYLIQNVASGNYVNTQDCDIAWNGLVNVSPLPVEDKEQNMPLAFYWEFSTNGTAFEPAGLPAHNGANIYSKVEGYLSMATGEGNTSWTSVQCRNDGVETWGTSKFNLLLVEDTDDIYYIQNEYMSTQYLHDGDEILSYAEKEDNANFQWQLIKTGKGYLIKNVESGNYVNTQECEISWNGLVKVSQPMPEEDPASDLGAPAVSVVTDRNLYYANSDGKYVSVEDATVSLTSDATKAASLTVEYVDGRVRLLTADGEYISVSDEDELILSAGTAGDYSSDCWYKDESGSSLTLRMGAIVLSLEKAKAVSVYGAKDAFTRNGGKERIFTVYADKTQDYELTLNYSSNAKASYDIKVNGAKQTALSFRSTNQVSKARKLTLTLNKGINLITFASVTGEISFDSLEMMEYNTVYRGATTTYTEYEAEDAETNGTVLDKSNQYREIASEASRRSAVELKDEGDYVSIVLKEATNSLVLRYVLPDSTTGGGIDATLNLYADGVKVQALDLNSHYSWVYGAYPWTNTRDNSTGHRFFDESSFLFDETYPAGTEFKLQKDADNDADYYIIDLIDTELVEAAYEQPANSLSIEEYGAVANDGIDDTKALNDCIAAAAAAGKEVYIPAGTFTLENQEPDGEHEPIELAVDGTIIRGAGMWHSILEGKDAGFVIKTNNIGLYDFAIQGVEDCRYDATGRTGVEVSIENGVTYNLTVANVWMEHVKAGIWTYRADSMQVAGCRIRDTYADGMNLSAGSNNAMIEQNNLRNTGDDGIGMWSSSDFGRMNTNNTIRFNTIGLQWLANSIAVYGGKDNNITDNILHDTVGFGAGVNVSSNFSPQGFAGTMTIARNTLRNSSSYQYDYGQEFGAIWFNCIGGSIMRDMTTVISDNDIMDSVYQGINFTGNQNAGTIVLDNNRITDCGTWGIGVESGVSGTLSDNNTIYSGSLRDTIYNASKQFEITQHNDESQVHVTTRRAAAGNESDHWVDNLLVAGVSVIPGISSVYTDETLQLRATVTPADADNTSLTWSSSDTRYATVDQNGKVTPTKAGAGKTVTITAKAKDNGNNSASGSSRVTINARKVTKVTVSPSGKDVKVGDKVTLKAAVTPLNATETAVTWISSNTKYATVDNNGVVTTKAAGVGKTVTITATAKDGSGCKGTSTINIKAIKVTKIAINASSKKIAAGKKVTLTAKVTPTNATNTAVTWKSSNTKYATVNSKGVVTTKKAGAGKTVTITATAKDGSGVKNTIKISIQKKAVTKITLKCAETLKVGKKTTVKVTIAPAKDVCKDVTFTSSNTKYATVNSKGVVTAKKAGKGKTVTITVKSLDGSGKKANIKIKIK